MYDSAPFHRFSPKQNSFSEDGKKVVSTEVASLLEKGAIREMPHNEAIVDNFHGA